MSESEFTGLKDFQDGVGENLKGWFIVTEEKLIGKMSEFQSNREARIRGITNYGD